MISTSVASPTRRASAIVWTEFATLAGFCAYLFFFGLGSFGLVGADEPRYAQIAREMLARHDWITPTLNGVPWLEKPALYYWSAILSYKIFGVSDWAARVPSAAFATAMVLAIYLFARRFRALPLDAALIAASFAAIIGFGRGASTDMPLTATFTIGMLAWYTWRETGRKMWLAAFYALMALGALAKGPVAPALSGAIIVLFAFLWRGSAARDPEVLTLVTRLRLIKRTLWLPGVLLFLGVALPWYIAVELQTHQFFRVFILEHNLERFGTNLYRHQQPYWYYVPVFLLSLLPWTVYVVAALVGSVRRELSTSRGIAIEPVKSVALPAETHAPGFPLFLLLWIAVPLVVFTISQSKLPGYMLPAVPPCALLVADWLNDRAPARASMIPIVLHSLICGALLSGALLAPYFILRAHPPARAIIIAVLAGAIIAVAVMASLRWQGLRVLRFVTLVPVVLGLAFVLRASAPVMDATQSARPVSTELVALNAGHAPVAAFNVTRELEFGLDFYRNQPVLRYERDQVPAAGHLVVARIGSEDKLRTYVSGRLVAHVGSFAPQKLDIYWVSAANR